MEREMHVLEAERRGETTRFVVGCEDQARTILEALKRAEFRILSESFTTPPERSESEKQRATRILGELFGH